MEDLSDSIEDLSDPVGLLPSQRCFTCEEETGVGIEDGMMDTPLHTHTHITRL